ncbi:nitroreductase [Diaphorobacter ruginosibacter]|uniref:nitroreductase n=1 Tax=Diaphorobacter ruginosibacter TaxID=1715720 RepID=UPI003340CDDC
MNVSQAMRERRSVRAYLSRVPQAADVEKLISDAALAASGGNLQPWRIIALAGEPLERLTAAMEGAQPQEEGAGFGTSYPPNLWEPYRTRRFKNGEDLYRTIGIPRENKAARLEQMARNGQFFGAPVGVFVFVDERMGYAQWVDLGIYLQSFMLLATERGMATCPQGYWRRFADTVESLLEVPDPYRVAYGIALGYEDRDASINTLRADRAPFGEWAQMRGF